MKSAFPFGEKVELQGNLAAIWCSATVSIMVGRVTNRNRCLFRQLSFSGNGSLGRSATDRSKFLIFVYKFGVSYRVLDIDPTVFRENFFLNDLFRARDSLRSRTSLRDTAANGNLDYTGKYCSSWLLLFTFPEHFLSGIFSLNVFHAKQIKQGLFGMCNLNLGACSSALNRIS